MLAAAPCCVATAGSSNAHSCHSTAAVGCTIGDADAHCTIAVPLLLMPTPCWLVETCGSRITGSFTIAAIVTVVAVVAVGSVN